MITRAPVFVKCFFRPLFINIGHNSHYIKIV